MSEMDESEAIRPALIPYQPVVEKPTAAEFWPRVKRRVHHSGAHLPAELILEFRDADRRG